MEIILITKYVQAIVIIEKVTPQDTYVFITFHVLIKPHVIKYASRMQAQKDDFYSAFFAFIFLCFTRLYLFCRLFLFFMFTCIEFQVRIMLHFAYSIFYIKPQTISVVKCNDIALNSCAVLFL